jgi:hypothetical protein
MSTNTKSQLSSSSSSGSQDNGQILNDIQSLQDIEQQLFSSLEDNNQNLSKDQQKQIIQKINDISNMRVNLYKNLSAINSSFQTNLSNSQGTLTDQTSAISIVENELNQAKAKLQDLEQEKNNKIRLIEINNYFGEKYAEHSQLMKIVVAVLFPILILALLNKKGILPNNVFTILTIIIAVIGSYFFWTRLLSIWSRDNMNYQEYNFPFNPNNAPISSTITSSTTSDPWSMTTTKSTYGTCIGDACCGSGLSWDSSSNQCIVASNTNTTVASSAASVSSSKISPMNKESFVNNVLSKPAYQFNKPDVVLGSEYIKPSYSSSFLNYGSF